MSECRICKHETPAGSPVCSPQCEDEFEQLKIDRNWEKIQYNAALDRLQSFEQDVYGRLYLQWDALRSKTNLVRAGIQFLSQRLAPPKPTLSPSELKDEFTEIPANIPGAKCREAQEWKEAQQESNTSDIRIGKMMFKRLKKRIRKLDQELSHIAPEHNSHREDTRDALRLRMNLIRAGVQLLSQQLASPKPTLSPSESKDEVTEIPANLREAKLRESQEWVEVQRESNAIAIQAGKQLFGRLEKRLEKLDQKLRNMEQAHNGLKKKKSTVERRFLHLQKKLGD